jgi:hypothetical protein
MPGPGVARGLGRHGIFRGGARRVAGHVRSGRIGRRRGRARARRRTVGGLLPHFALGALGEAIRALLLAEMEGGARRFPAAQQIRIGNATDSGAIELGQHGATRVRRDRGDRADARSKSEPVQRQRGFRLGIPSHEPSEANTFGRPAMSRMPRCT